MGGCFFFFFSLARNLKNSVGDGWSKEATDEFEKLSHCAQWISLMARVVNYSGEIPCLELIDTAGKAVSYYTCWVSGFNLRPTIICTGRKLSC